MATQREKFQSQTDSPELAPNPPVPRVPAEIKSRIRDPAAREAIEWWENAWDDYFRQSRIRQL